MKTEETNFKTIVSKLFLTVVTEKMSTKSRRLETGCGMNKFFFQTGQEWQDSQIQYQFRNGQH